ncbi:MAG: hypothetical protein OEV66_11290, partial [Spirochaetia bacterium]|nr:hypothetical protein [Spirochaetia bacterium]
MQEKISMRKIALKYSPRIAGLNQDRHFKDIISKKCLSMTSAVYTKKSGAFFNAPALIVAVL